MLKKLIVAAAAAGAMSVPLAGLASADQGSGQNPFNVISGSNNPAFTDSGFGSIMNVNNNLIRFGADGKVAIPGVAGGYANENSVVGPWSTLGSTTIIAPRGRPPGAGTQPGA
jgi:hypothetical protein